MAFPIMAALTAASLAKSLFSKQGQPQQQGSSPFMGREELDRYMALRDIMKRVKSPYMANMMGRDGGFGGY